MPGEFRDKVVDIHKERGRAWLDNLPQLIAEIEQRWHISVKDAMPDLSYNYIAPAVCSDGSDAVLKLGVPCDEICMEIAALRLYGGRGAVCLLEHSEEIGAMLLERALPGTPLRLFPDDDAATVVAAGVIRKLQRAFPEEPSLPSARQWADGLSKARAHFGGGTGPLPSEIFEAAESIFRDLFDSPQPQVLVHGDLHHGNILASEREGWLAIDPKGITGEETYQGAFFILNTELPELDDTEARGKLTRRINLLATELAQDSARIRAWAKAHAVLSAWWSVEDHGRGWEHATRIASLL